jgi:hypothetical protein
MAEDKPFEDSQTVVKAMKQVEKLGLPFPGKPDEKDVAWPSNVAEISSQDLAKHLSWWSGWASYIRYHLAQAETNETAYLEMYKHQEQHEIANSKGDFKTVTELKANVANNPTLVRIKQDMLQAKALRKMLGALLEGYEKKYATISREISRRGAEFEDSKRNM